MEMEMVLAIVVASAVIFFGALISMGNERQRKAIDDLRDQIVQWAIQDLRVKSESINIKNRIADPLVWLSRIAERIIGIKSNLQFVEYCQYPKALVCASDDGTHQIIFSPLSPVELRRIRKSRRNHLSNYATTNILLSLRPRDRFFEINPLNFDIFFSQEISIVWKLLSGEQLNATNRLWLYQCSK